MIGVPLPTVAAPSMLVHTDDDVTTWRRHGISTPALRGPAAVSAAPHASVAAPAPATAHDPAPAAAAVAAPAMFSLKTSQPFAPPQLRRKNVVTEDTAAWNTARKSKTVRKADDEPEAPSSKLPKKDAAE